MKNQSWHTYEWVMSHIWMRPVTHMNESCHTYDWVMSHMWMSHITHMTESCHTYEWVTSHIWMSHVTHMNCHIMTEERIFEKLHLIRVCWQRQLQTWGWAWRRESSRILKNRNTTLTSGRWIQIDGLRGPKMLARPCWDTYESSHVYIVTLPWLIHVLDWTQSCMRHDSFIKVTWLIYICDVFNGRWIRMDGLRASKMLAVGTHVCMSHVTYMNESCSTHEWVKSYIWMSHVTHMNESYYAFEWACCSVLQCVAVCCSVLQCFAVCVLRIWTCHVTLLNRSCDSPWPCGDPQSPLWRQNHSQIWISDWSCLMRDKTHVRHDSVICVTWLIHMCNMTHVSHDSCEPWLMRDMTHVRYESVICVTWLIHMCDVTHSCVWYDSFISVTLNQRPCDDRAMWMWHESVICVTWLIYTCVPDSVLAFAIPHPCVDWVMAHICMSHVRQINESWRPYEWVMAYIWMSHGPNMNESWHAYE